MYVLLTLPLYRHHLNHGASTGPNIRENRIYALSVSHTHPPTHAIFTYRYEYVYIYTYIYTYICICICMCICIPLSPTLSPGTFSIMAPVEGQKFDKFEDSSLVAAWKDKKGAFIEVKVE